MHIKGQDRSVCYEKSIMMFCNRIELQGQEFTILVLTLGMVGLDLLILLLLLL